MATPDLDPDLFDTAADLIEQNGWEQGFDRKSGLCVDDALCKAARKLVTGLGIIDLAPIVKAQIGLDDTDVLWAWNDAPERTEQEVLDALRGTAKAVRRQQEGLQ